MNRLGDRASTPAHIVALRLISPAAGSIFVIDPDLPTSREIPLRAEGPSALKLQSETLTCIEKTGAAYAEARPGRHRLIVTDTAGHTAETWVTIKSL